MEQYLQDFENSRLVIYTAIIGDYDTLKEPEYIDENCDYICFTDNWELTSDIWQIRLVENTSLDSTRLQRMYKVLPQQDPGVLPRRKAFAQAAQHRHQPQ